MYYIIKRDNTKQPCDPNMIEQAVLKAFIAVDGKVTDYAEEKPKNIADYIEGYMEGIPKSLMEAASMGRALIATDSTGCKDVVLDGVNGLLCEKRSVDSLVDAMRRMLEMPADQLQEMGQKGRELMLRKFDEKLIINEYNKAFETYA